MKSQKVEFKQVVKRGCGIDVHKKVLVATIRGDGIKSETRTFDSFTSSIIELQDWLLDNKITHVAMESTGVYWKPVYNVIEDNFEVLLVNARHIKNVPGQKTDKKDSEWIAKLLLSGLLKGSFIPPKHIRELRDITRYKRKIKEQIASEKNRIHRVLEDANIKISSVVSNINGSSATKIIDAMIEGEENVDELVKLRHGNIKSNVEDMILALEGNLTTHHKFMLETLKTSIVEKVKLLSILDVKIEELLENSKLEVDAELLQSIPGVSKEGAAYIIAEIGDNMDQFPDEKHLSSWAGMSPGNNESAGKKKVVASHMETNI